MRKEINGKELYELYTDIVCDEYNNEKVKFNLRVIPKEILFKDNLCHIDDYFDEDEEEVDERHEKTIYSMINHVRGGGLLPPIIVNKDGILIDGSHRLTAYSIMGEIENITIYQEVE